MDILARLPATPLRLVTFHLVQSLAARSATHPARRYASTTATSGASQDKRKAYSHTLLLPKTSMPLKHKRPPEEERKFRARSTDELYRRQVSAPSPC
jgi:isoleucyl-tRNA synthetase